MTNWKYTIQKGFFKLGAFSLVFRLHKLKLWIENMQYKKRFHTRNIVLTAFKLRKKTNKLKICKIKNGFALWTFQSIYTEIVKWKYAKQKRVCITVPLHNTVSIKSSWSAQILPGLSWEIWSVWEWSFWGRWTNRGLVCASENVF